MNRDNPERMERKDFSPLPIRQLFSRDAKERAAGSGVVSLPIHIEFGSRRLRFIISKESQPIFPSTYTRGDHECELKLAKQDESRHQYLGRLCRKLAAVRKKFSLEIEAGSRLAEQSQELSPATHMERTP